MKYENLHLLTVWLCSKKKFKWLDLCHTDCNVPRLLIFYCKTILSDSSLCFILNAFFIFHVVLYADKEAPEQMIESSDSKLLVTPSDHGKGGVLSPYYVSTVAFLLKKIIIQSPLYLHCVT